MVVLRSAMGRLWRLLWLAFFFLLSACATPPAIQGPDGENAFVRSGRFAITVDDTVNPPQAVQGGFAWYDAGHKLVLDLANPLGSTLARVEVFSGKAMLTRSDGSVQEAASPDDLVAQVVGANIPVSGLRAWLRGNTDRALAQDIQTDARGQVVGFNQQGWVVVLSRHDAQGPRLLQLSRKEGLRSISVRLIIDAS